MDVNGTQFHLLTGADEWEPLLDLRGAADLWWDRDARVLSLLPRILNFGEGAAAPELMPETRRGADMDSYGNVYWIGDDRAGGDATAGTRIRYLPQDAQQAGDYWNPPGDEACPESPDADFVASAAPGLPARPRLRGLAVTRDHFLVVGSVAPAGLVVFDLHGGGPPSWLAWPEELPFAPFDISAGADGSLWILGRSLDMTEARLWRLDSTFRLMPLRAGTTELSNAQPDFTPHDVSSSGDAKSIRFPLGQSLMNGSPIEVDDPIAIEALPDGSTLVLGLSDTADYSVVHRFSRDGEHLGQFDLEGGILERVLSDPRVIAHDFAFVATTGDRPCDEVEGTLTIVVSNGNQALAFGLSAFRDQWRLTLEPEYLPLRRFSGKALVRGPAAAFYDIRERWYPVTAQPRRRYAERASVDGLIFDGKEPGCVWHRIVLDACIPEGSTVEVWTRAADERDRLGELDWKIEPVPYLRRDGAEIPLHEPWSDSESQRPGTGTWELLLQAARGRWIEVRLSLAGDGRVSPRIRALRAYFPRFSYLRQFLPAVYREEPTSANFLDRYLANAEGMFAAIEARIAQAESLFDSRTAPPAYLDWLAAWFGATLDDEWDERRRRLFLANAALLFRWRGTRIGMRAAVRLAMDPCPDDSIFDELRDERASSPTGAGGQQVRIVERFRYRDLPGVLIGDPTGQSELSVTDSSGSDFIDDEEALNQRYREFLRWRYTARASVGQTALDALNEAWGTALQAIDDDYVPGGRCR